MKHEKTFAAIKKLQEVEIELHRLKNALELANKALDAKRTWVGLTDDDKKEYVAQDFGGNRLDAMDWAAQRLKEKNNG